MKLLKSAMGRVIEGVANTAIRADRDHELLLQTVYNKRLAVSLVDFNLRLVASGEQHKLRVSVNDHAEADAEVQGGLIDLLRLGVSDKPESIISSDKINVTGEVSVLQSYQKFMAQLDIDWEGRLSEVIGPIAAAEIGKMAARAKAFWQHDAKATTQDISEYITEELKVCPPKEEVEDFYEDILSLKSDVERLALRIKRL